MSLKLRDDLHWQDGEPITAKDVIFSYNELTRPGSIYPLKDDFWFVDSVEEVGALEIRIECAASSAVHAGELGKTSHTPRPPAYPKQ